MAFTFSFSGDDIITSPPLASSPPAAVAAAAPTTSAFPIPGCPQLPPTRHTLAGIAARLPSHLSYSLLDAGLTGGAQKLLPRRELWDVRVQVMAEDDADDSALGPLDVKTGVYEGGFKSWESSVDLVQVLQQMVQPEVLEQRLRIIELGCGTALPSLFLFQAALSRRPGLRAPINFILADYNPSVLELVSLPNLLLAWALDQNLRPNPSALIADSLATPGELQISPPLLQAFYAHLAHLNITISFLSGAWSPAFVDLIYTNDVPAYSSATATTPTTLILGSETIYSPPALEAFTETIIDILNRALSYSAAEAQAIVAAKRHYFGVGGSLDDFVLKANDLGAEVSWMKEETQGIRRGVVRCHVPLADHHTA